MKHVIAQGIVYIIRGAGIICQTIAYVMIGLSLSVFAITYWSGYHIHKWVDRDTTRVWTKTALWDTLKSLAHNWKTDCLDMWLGKNPFGK